MFNWKQIAVVIAAFAFVEIVINAAPIKSRWLRDIFLLVFGGMTMLYIHALRDKDNSN